MKVRVTPAAIGALLCLAKLDAEGEGSGAPEGPFGPGRVDLEKKVPAAVLERYALLVARRRSPAVIPVEQGCCSACHLRLPAALDQEIRMAPGLFSCPYCQRFLYAPRHVPAPRRGHAGAAASVPPSATKR